MEGKLKFFESSIKSRVSEKKKELENQMKEYKKEELEEFENQLLEEAFIKMQSKISALNAETRLEIKEISEKYNEKISFLAQSYYDRIFLEVAKRLGNYSKTSEYKEKLIEEIKNLQNVHSIKLSSKDKDLFSKIKNLTSADVSSDDEAVLIGGFIAVLNDGTIIDKSIATAFSAEKNRFLSENNLIVNKTL